jgi:CheY-like chemotaxis protein
VCEQEIKKERGLILVVDDDMGVLGVYQDALIRMGFSVITATNGQEGVSKFIESKEVIDCVLLDSQMPIMNGRDALLHIKKNQSPNSSYYAYGAYSGL